jgi:hypothetical protein
MRSVKIIMKKLLTPHPSLFTPHPSLLTPQKHCSPALLSYDVECCLKDSAFCLDSNVGFAHWVAHMTNRETEKKFDVEGLEVETFNKEDQLSNILMFRDPMDFERDRLKACCEGMLPKERFYFANPTLDHGMSLGDRSKLTVLGWNSFRQTH